MLQSVLGARALEMCDPPEILARCLASDSLGSLCLLVSLSFCFVVLISGWGGSPGGAHGAKGHCIVAVPPPVACGGERAQKQGSGRCYSVAVAAGGGLFYGVGRRKLSVSKHKGHVRCFA